MRKLSEKEPNNVRIWFDSFCYGCQKCTLVVNEHESRTRVDDRLIMYDIMCEHRDACVRMYEKMKEEQEVSHEDPEAKQIKDTMETLRDTHDPFDIPGNRIHHESNSGRSGGNHPESRYTV